MKKTTKKPAPAAAATPAKSPAKAAPKAPAKKAAPAKKKPAVAGEPPPTTISARINIGFGNHLALRGEGPGLSWDRGTVMDCASADLWTYTVKGATAPVVFKVLVNDLNWSTGNDYVVEPGQSVTVSPTF
jgi:hypothetical protein